MACLLLGRIYVLRLQGVYRIFVVYLVAEIAGPVLYQFVGIDYTTLFLISRPIYWVLYISMVYALAKAIMSSAPGVYRLSRKVLQWSFGAAAAAGVVTFAFSGVPTTWTVSPDFLLLFARILERSFALTAFLLLVGVLAFLLWFPVQVPRNLAIFSGGYLVFFAVTVTSLFIGDFVSRNSEKLINAATGLVSLACYVWWLVALSKAGEEQPVRIGHSWKPAEQQKLIGRLGEINDALLASSRRM